MTTYVNAVAPESALVTVKRGPNSTLDFTTISAASFEVLKADGSPATWTAALSAQTTTQITLEHVYQPGDLNAPGTYILVPKLTVPGGTVNGQAVKLPVTDPYKR